MMGLIVIPYDQNLPFGCLLQGDVTVNQYLPHMFSQFTSPLERTLLTLLAQKTLQTTLLRNGDSIRIGIQILK